MVGQRHRGIADAGREQLHQHGGDRPVDHGHVDHQDDQDHQHHDRVHLCRVCLGRVAGGGHGAADFLLERRDLGLAGVVEAVAVGELGVEGLDLLVADLHRGHRAGRRVHHLIAGRRLGQGTLGDIARAAEVDLAGDRAALEGALLRIGGHHDLRGLLGALQRRVGVVGQRLEQREVGQHGQRAARHDDPLAPDLVRQRAEEDKERRADHQCAGDQQVGRLGIDLEHLRQEEQRVELAGVPDHGLAGGQAEQGQDHDLQVAPLRERFGQRSLGGLALGLHALECRRFIHRQPDVHRHPQQQDRQQEGDAPAPGFERRAGQLAAQQDHDQRQEQAQRRSGLDPRGVRPALAMRRVLGHVGGGTAVLAAEAQAAEHQRAERPHDKAGGKGEQREDEGRGRIQTGEELLGDDRRQRAVQIKVVPLEHRAQRRGKDHLALLACHRCVLRTPSGYRNVLHVCHLVSSVWNGSRARRGNIAEKARAAGREPELQRIVVREAY
ncbi:hypothetical protein D9M69_427800 [compost metagenome]